jgi:hypothetical protein
VVAVWVEWRVVWLAQSMEPLDRIKLLAVCKEQTRKWGFMAFPAQDKAAVLPVLVACLTN